MNCVLSLTKKTTFVLGTSCCLSQPVLWDFVWIASGTSDTRQPGTPSEQWINHRPRYCFWTL